MDEWMDGWQMERKKDDRCTETDAEKGKKETDSLNDGQIIK